MTRNQVLGAFPESFPPSIVPKSFPIVPAAKNKHSLSFPPIVPPLPSPLRERVGNDTNGNPKVRKRSVLHREEQIALCVRAQAGDLKARDELVRATMGFVRQQARRLAKRCKSLTEDDLATEGAMGVVRAITKFEPERGLAFLTYASNWVTSRMRRAIYEQDSVQSGPVWAQEKVSSGAFTREWRALEEEGKTVEEIRREISKRHGWRESSIRGLESLAFSPTHSLDVPVSTVAKESNAMTFGDMVASSEPGADVALDAQDRLDGIRAAIDAVRVLLPARERDILDTRLTPDGDPDSLQQLGERWGCSRERIRQLEVVLLGRLRRQLALTLDANGELLPKAKRVQRSVRAAEVPTLPAPLVAAGDPIAQIFRPQNNIRTPKEPTEMGKTRNTNGLTEQQQRVLDAYNGLLRSKGSPPKDGEVAEAAGIAGTDVVRTAVANNTLRTLRGKGLVAPKDSSVSLVARQREPRASKTAPVATPSPAKTSRPLVVELEAARDALVARAQALTAAIEALGGA